MNERKSYRLQVPIAESDRKRVQAVANSMDMNVATWVRWAIKQTIKQMEGNK